MNCSKNWQSSEVKCRVINYDNVEDVNAHGREDSQHQDVLSNKTQQFQYYYARGH
jgi:hypothetical protein